MKTQISQPGEKLPQEYFDVRYEILRKPLGAPKGSEQLAKDNDAIHVWMEMDGKIVAVGRAHLLEDNEDGSVVDVGANSKCPAFSPLTKDASEMEDDSGTTIGPELRPAVQIRAMGTLDEFQGQGLASKVLETLEIESAARWHAKTGWLQARLEAIPFYEASGWCCFGPEYNVPNVGPHVSMWKKL
ncbi:MAG: N-acetyltransferase [Bacteroidetes bacterium]|nr:MAG: N-acetyltransferase [Bacteroidota bacterium]